MCVGEAGVGKAAETKTEEKILVHYDMSRTESGKLADMSGNGYDAELVNLTEDNFDKDGEREICRFQNNGYIKLPDFLAGGEEEVTIKITYKIGSNNNEGLLAFGGKNLDSYLRFHPNENKTTFLWESILAGGNGYCKEKGFASYGGSRYATMTAVIKKNHTLTYYMNGKKQGVLDMKGASLQRILDTGAQRSANMIGYIGRPIYENDPYFSGVLDEFTVYGYALAENEIVGDTQKTTASDTKIVSQILPEEAALGGEEWKEYMISGNGKNGVLYAGYPYDDVLIYQNMYLIMPSTTTRVNPYYYDALESNRQAVIKQENNMKLGSLLFLYPHHPGPKLRMQMSDSMGSGTDYSDYERWTDYETAEAGVTYTNAQGTWERRTFTSRADDVTITEITKSSEGEKVSMEISLDNLSSIPKFTDDSWNQGPMHMQYKKLVDEDADYISLVGKYPGTGGFSGSELKNGGYVGTAQVIAVGGKKEWVNNTDTSRDTQNVGADTDPRIKITGADAVYIIERTDRTWDMCTFDAFKDKQQYDLLDELKTEITKVADKYTENGVFNYQKALESHVKLHRKEFDSVNFSLDADEADIALPTESLKSEQKADKEVNLAMAERAYYAGRYAQICCSGYSAPRLGGMWTGEWNPGWWRSSYTMDANVNLQVSSMNTGNLTEAPVGYITFILRQLDDWMENAENTYGMHDAIKTPINTDGDVAIGIESDYNYPHQYWNAGASWMLLPIYEYWQCYGNQKIPIKDEMRLYENKAALGIEDGGLSDTEIKALINRGYLDLEEDILLPLLTKQANFWEQLVTPEYYVDLDGTPHYQKGKASLNEDERYLIIPSFSSENHPKRDGKYTWDAQVTMNSTMDISAARSGLLMTIEMEKAVNRADSEKAIKKWENLIAELPEYQYDGEPGSAETATGGGGALKEWAVNVYQENNEHRHLSHLYVAWPEYETQHDEALEKAAQQAFANRNRINSGTEATTGHGWLHSALVAARLKDGEEVYRCMHYLLSSDIYYTSLVTDHNTDRGSGTYCTDTALGMVGVINESLLFSNTGEIEVLPALPKKWETGSINGLMARTRAEVEELQWNQKEQTSTVKIRSDIEQEITLTCGQDWKYASVEGIKNAEINEGQSVVLNLAAGEEVTVTFSMKELAPQPPVPPEKLPYVDVKEGDWFYDGVYYNYFAETMTGKDKTHFAPLENLARAQFAVIIHRMQNKPEMKYTAKFPDVAEGIWYTDAILWAADKKIVNGYSDTGLFGPADNINREQMAVIRGCGKRE